MNKLILIMALLGVANISNAQDGIEAIIYSHTHSTYVGPVSQMDFPTYDFSGGIVELTPDNSEELVIDIDWENHTSNSDDWRVSRRRLNEIAGWTDYFCWRHETDPVGICIDGATMDMELYTLHPSQGVTVADGEKAVLAAHIHPDMNASGCATYRYYLGTQFDPFVDSVDIQVCFSLGSDELTSNQITVSPNPANDYFNIHTTGSLSGSVYVLDMTGKVVLETAAQGSITSINTASLNDGVYMLRLEGEEQSNQKIIIRH